MYPDYNAQKSNGFSFRDTGANEDLAMIYRCEDGFLGLWKYEQGYVLKSQGSKRTNEEVATIGTNMFAKLEGWSEGDMATTTNNGDCNYPVQILIGNEKPAYCSLNIGGIDFGSMIASCE